MKRGRALTRTNAGRQMPAASRREPKPASNETLETTHRAGRKHGERTHEGLGLDGLVDRQNRGKVLRKGRNAARSK